MHRTAEAVRPLRKAAGNSADAVPVVGKTLNELWTPPYLSLSSEDVILGFMTTVHFTDEIAPDPDSTDSKQGLRVVIAYDDLAAGKRAMRVLAELSKGLGEALELQPFPWSFEVLLDANWRGAGTNDAAVADILMIATSGATPFAPRIARWIETIIRQKQGTDAAVVVLVGEESKSVPGLDWLSSIQGMALRAGLAFFAPAVRRELNETALGVHRRAELLTPLLDQILQRSPPHFPLRWGINE